MDRGAKTLILGIVVGAASVVLALRLRQLIEERDPDILVEKIADQLEELEARIARHA
jgi:hypothetical protein